MTEAELLRGITGGDCNRHQFSRNATTADSLVPELSVLVSCGDRCCLLLGMGDDGTVGGLDDVAVQWLQQLLSNVANQHVPSPLSPLRRNLQTVQ